MTGTRKLYFALMLVLFTLPIIGTVSAASSKVWPDIGDSIIWSIKISEDKPYTTDEKEYYIKIEITDKKSTDTNLTVQYKGYKISKEDADLYGIDNDSAWSTYSYYGSEKAYIDNASLYENLHPLINTLDLDLLNLATLPEKNRSDLLMGWEASLNPEFSSFLLGYALIAGFLWVNDTSNSTVMTGMLKYQVNITQNFFFAYHNGTHWNNMSFYSDSGGIYGKTSKILLTYHSKGSISTVGYNGTVGDYVNETTYFEVHYMIYSPSALVNDFPSLLDNIPGFPPMAILAFIGLASLYLIVRKFGKRR